MEVFDLLWTLAFTVSGILFAAGFDVIGPSKRDFHKSRICFRLAPLPLTIMTIIWAMTTDNSLWLRITITGLFGAALLIGLSESLRWVKYREAAVENPSLSDSTQQKEFPQIVLVGHPIVGQINLYNKGEKDIYMWGTKFDNEVPSIEAQSRTIPKEGFYYLLTDKLEGVTRQIIGANGEKLFPFEVYLADTFNHHYTAKFNLLIKFKEGVMSVHTQQLGVVEENWKSNLDGGIPPIPKKK